ncbi:MAG: thioredoxin family protein [Tepidisphaeraceae bacterium]|jgi:thiol-disulfide isomerase/thioredoxin
MMKSDYLSDKFAAGLSYGEYVATGTAEQQRRWTAVYQAARLTPGQKELLAGFVRQMNVLVLSGIWCGDCVQQVPLLARIAEAAQDRIDLRIVDRDLHRDLARQVRINGGDRVPVVLLLAEDQELCAIFGDRTLARYRAMARQQLGPSCPVGIEAPDGAELAACLGEWLNEVERVQLMLRLSARLQQRHHD